MKRIVLIVGFIMCGFINAQANFEKGMRKAFDLWSNNKIEEAENLFERIANAEKDNWLPHYYIAQINSLKSWNEKDENILKAQLDKAQKHLDLAMAFSENNPELLVMQGQVLTNWIAFDGMTYGMKYSAKVSELYNKAYSIAPKNPRVVMCKGDWAMGTARYFGKDPSAHCKEVESAIALFDAFKPESEFHPNWGRQRADEILKECKK